MEGHRRSALIAHSSSGEEALEPSRAGVFPRNVSHSVTFVLGGCAFLSSLRSGNAHQSHWNCALNGRNRTGLRLLRGGRGRRRSWVGGMCHESSIAQAFGEGKGGEGVHPHLNPLPEGEEAKGDPLSISPCEGERLGRAPPARGRGWEELALAGREVGKSSP